MDCVVCVVIPTFERNTFLREAVQSVHAAWRTEGRSLNELEVVVVDDAHSAECETLCATMSAESGLRVRYLRSAYGPRAGPAACRAQGVNTSGADFIFLLDDDDTYFCGRFRRALSLLESAAADAVLEVTLRVRDGDRSNAFRTGPAENETAFDPYLFLLNGGPSTHITPGATSFSRRAFQQAGSWNRELRFGEDGEFLMRLCLKANVVLLSGEPVCEYRLHSNNATTTSKLAYWQPMKSLYVHWRAVRSSIDQVRGDALVRAIQGKLDFALTKVRQEAKSRTDRLIDGCRVLRWMPLRLLTMQNIKSVVVWLVAR